LRADVAQPLKMGLDRRALVDRIEDHLIEQARLIGLHER
jgi:hypothetical protein